MTATKRLPTLRLKPHDDVKQAVVADAKNRGLSVNNVVLEILGEALDVKVEGTGRRSNGAWAGNGGTSPSAAISVPTPPKLHLKVQREAERRQRERQRREGATARYSMNEVCERILCDRYGLEYAAR